MSGEERTAPGRPDSPGAGSFSLDPGSLLQGLVGGTREELSRQTVEGLAGGGAVRVTMAGDGEVTAVRISPAAVEPLDLELLEELIISALADARRQVQAVKMQSLGRLAEAFGLGEAPKE